MGDPGGEERKTNNPSSEDERIPLEKVGEGQQTDSPSSAQCMELTKFPQAPRHRSPNNLPPRHRPPPDPEEEKIEEMIAGNIEELKGLRKKEPEGMKEDEMKTEKQDVNDEEQDIHKGVMVHCDRLKSGEIWSSKVGHGTRIERILRNLLTKFNYPSGNLYLKNGTKLDANRTVREYLGENEHELNVVLLTKELDQQSQSAKPAASPQTLSHQSFEITPFRHDIDDTEITKYGSPVRKKKKRQHPSTDESIGKPKRKESKRKHIRDNSVRKKLQFDECDETKTAVAQKHPTKSFPLETQCRREYQVLSLNGKVLRIETLDSVTISGLKRHIMAEYNMKQEFPGYLTHNRRPVNDNQVLKEFDPQIQFIWNGRLLAGARGRQRQNLSQRSRSMGVSAKFSCPLKCATSKTWKSAASLKNHIREHHNYLEAAKQIGPATLQLIRLSWCQECERLQPITRAHKKLDQYGRSTGETCPGQVIDPDELCAMEIDKGVQSELEYKNEGAHMDIDDDFEEKENYPQEYGGNEELAMDLEELMESMRYRPKLIKKIPKSLHRQVTAAYTEAIRTINSAPQYMGNWVPYMMLTRWCLYAPPRGGKKQRKSHFKCLEKKLKLFTKGKLQTLHDAYKLTMYNPKRRQTEPAEEGV